jgi:hypothetical protein
MVRGEMRAGLRLAGHWYRNGAKTMKIKHALIAGLFGTAALIAAGSAGATVRTFDFTTYEAKFSSPLGSITVNDFGGTGSVVIDVALAAGVAFQVDGGAGSLNDILWWDLGGGATSIGGLGTAYIAPVAGAYPTGGQFSDAVFSNNAFRNGSGFLSGFDYGIAVKDTINPKDYYGAPGHLKFTLTGTGLSAASFTSQSETPKDGSAANIFFGADLRQTLSTGAVITGPAGATERDPGGPGTSVPEPAVWTMMILGFGGVGAMMRRRRLVSA